MARGDAGDDTPDDACDGAPLALDTLQRDILIAQVDAFLGATSDPQAHPQPVVVSIGPATSDTARARGLRVDIEAVDHTIDGVVTALLEVLASLKAVEQT